MTEFFTITLIGLLVIISPGPDFAIVTKTSLTQGRLAGILSAVGIAVANLCHVLINLLGIGLVIAQSVMAFTIMKILGAAYLLYIGFKGLRAKPMPVDCEPVKMTQPRKEQPHRGFMVGFITSILNPKACLFYLSFFSVILSAKTPLLHQIIYGVWLSTLACLWFILVAVFFTHPYIAMRLKNIKHWIERVTGGVLMLLGLRLLTIKVAA